jgi:hypothetical protein
MSPDHICPRNTLHKMTIKKTLFALLAWMQLLVSLLLASTVVWGYVSYQASFGQFVHSVAASIEAVSNVVIRTAETVESRRDMLDSAAQMLVVTRSLVTELKVASENQVKALPQYAEGMRSASTAVGKLSSTLDSIGDRFLKLPLPAVRMDGMKPTIVIAHPLQIQGQELKANAADLKAVAGTLSNISVALDRDGTNVSLAFVATSDQALKVISEVEKTLSHLKSQDLPKALTDLKTTTEKLKSISVQVDLVGNFGRVLLVVGLLLSGWCFLHSLGALMLAKSHEIGLGAMA